METKRNLSKRAHQERISSESRLARQRASMRALRALREKPKVFCTGLDVQVLFFHASKLPARVSQAKRYFLEDDILTAI